MKDKNITVGEAVKRWGNGFVLKIGRKAMRIYEKTT